MGKIQIIQSGDQSTQDVPFHHNWVYFANKDKGYHLDAVFPEDFSNKVEKIPVGDLDEVLAAHDELITELEQQVILASDVKLQDKTVTPSSSVQTVRADEGYDALGTVTVNVPETTTQAVPNIVVDDNGNIVASVTQDGGYVSGGTRTATKQMKTQEGKTVIPTTTEQVAVEAGVYTTGEIKVAGSGGESVETCVMVFPHIDVSSFQWFVIYSGLDDNGNITVKKAGSLGGQTKQLVIYPICGSAVVANSSSIWDSVELSGTGEYCGIFNQRHVLKAPSVAGERCYVTEGTEEGGIMPDPLE